MLIGISLFLTMVVMILMAPATLGSFAASSTIAGIGVSVWLSSRHVVQSVFVETEQPAVKLAQAAALRVWTVSAALTLGILIGYLLAQLLSLQVHAQSLVQTTTLA